MHSCAWMNGQSQQVGQSSQAATYDKMRTQQAATANNYSQYMTANSRARPPQSANGIFWDGGTRQMTNCQTTAASPQSVSFQQPARWKDNNSILKFLLQDSSTNTQTGNPSMLVTNEFQGPTQHNFSHNSAPNSFPQSPPGMMVANTTYPHQDMPQYWDQPVHRSQSIWTKDGNIVSDLQHYRVKKPLNKNVNVELMKHISAYTTKATSLMCKQDTNTIMSTTAPNRQAVNIHIQRQNGTQHGLLSPSPCYSTAVPQSPENNSYTAKSLSSGQILRASSVNQKAQQYAPKLNTTQSIGQDTSCLVNSNSCSSQYEISNFLLKTNPSLFNGTASTQQKMPKVARIVDTLHISDTAGSDAHPLLYTSSSYRGKQVVNRVRMTESNQTLQPVIATEAQIYNSNTTPLFSASSGQYLSKTTQNVISSTQHFANVPPQQNSAVDSLNVTRASDESRSQADSSLSKRSLVGFSNKVSQLTEVLENISPQKDKTQLSTAKSNEMLEILEKLSPGKQSDCYIHSSPAHTGTRAVAIVQPLSEESYQVASKCSSFNAINELGECSTPEKSLSNPDKACISPVAKKQKPVDSREGVNLYTENPNQIRPNEFSMKLSPTPDDDIVVSPSSSAGPQDLWPKQLSADDTRSNPGINMLADQWLLIAEQLFQPAEVPGDQKSKMDKRETPTGLSSLQTTPWTTVMLTNLIEDEEKAQKEKDFTKLDSAGKILTMFWNGSCRMLAEKLKTGWYKNLITDVIEFCDKQVTADSVILLQVKHSFGKLHKSYSVLKDNEVYSELTYKSSWLNVNERLDDIDKEFGFPWSLKHGLSVLESDSEPNQDKKMSSIPAQIESDVPNKVLSQIGPVVSGEEKQAPSVEPTITQASSPCKTDCADLSDPFYDIEIQVLPPEEARKIFMQLQSNMTQTKDMDNQSEEVVNSPTEDELHEIKDVTFKKSKLKKKSVSAIEQVCCLSKWMEIIVGPNGLPLSKCQCKEEQSHKDSTEKTLVKKETIAEKSLSMFDLKHHSAVKGENQDDCDNQASGGEKIHMVTFSCPEFSDEGSQSVDLNEDRQPHLYFDKETNDISHISLNDSQSSIIMISESEAEENSGSEKEFPKQMPALGIKIKDPEEECEQDQLQSAQNRPSIDSENCKKENKKDFSIEVVNQISDPKELNEQAQETSTDMTTLSLESQKEKCKAVDRKRNTLSKKDGILPFLRTMKNSKPVVDLDSQPVFQDVKCKKDFGDAPETKHLAKNGRTVELMLFGLASQDKCIIASSPKSRVPLLPPEVLTMHLSPLRRMRHDPTGAHSTKQWIREKGRSLPPNQISNRGKMKTQKCTFASISQASFKKGETASTNTMEPPMKMRNKISERSLSLKRKSSHSNGGKIREEKMKKDTLTLKDSVEQVRSESDNGGHAGIPLKENNVLRFNILPNTFNFKSGSSEIKEITDPVLDIPDHAENNHKCPNKTTMRERGTTWYPNPEKKFCPLPLPTVAKMPGLFQEFQKKYMQKTQKKK
ncbi:hypothetical protein EXN66_Car004715 [Channa argus]|uniref:Uncharacterized protein n=1 Tax=Channa argus TaxID=215402 RepID=A0A6G1PFS8_CHAAH|nr:hypothetical protein EXN66_Car004715 [Channa argus]KAK2918080.1 hypothetical protein Q8A73_004826 [Channa argus]